MTKLPIHPEPDKSYQPRTALHGLAYLLGVYRAWGESFDEAAAIGYVRTRDALAAGERVVPTPSLLNRLRESHRDGIDMMA